MTDKIKKTDKSKKSTHIPISNVRRIIKANVIDQNENITKMSAGVPELIAKATVTYYCFHLLNNFLKC